MPQESARGIAAWLRRWWRALLSELLATALLVLLGVAALLPTGGVPQPLAHPALAFGFMVLMNVEVFGPVSGAHMNPAVTLTAVLDRRLGVLPALGYLLAQLLGAVLGFAALMGVAAKSFPEEGAGGTAPGPGVHPVAAAAVEALLTGSLALLCCALWSAHERDGPDRGASVKLGLTVAGLVYAGAALVAIAPGTIPQRALLVYLYAVFSIICFSGLLTGASLNPARSFAPALLQGFDKDHWVYWVGPLGGAAVAALLHRLIRAPPPSALRDVELPLQDKPDH